MSNTRGQVVFRRASTQDAPQIAEIARLNGLPRSWTDKSVAAWLALSTSHGLVASSSLALGMELGSAPASVPAGLPLDPEPAEALEREGDLSGFLLGSVVVDEAEVVLIAVRPEQARRGLGRRLLEGFEVTAHRLGAVRAHLEVSSVNISALAFYLACGYAEEGQRRGYYAEGEDAVLMGRTLGDAKDAACGREGATTKSR